MFVALYGKKVLDSLNTCRQHMLASSHSYLRRLTSTEYSFQLHILSAVSACCVQKSSSK